MLFMNYKIFLKKILSIFTKNLKKQKRVFLWIKSIQITI